MGSSPTFGTTFRHEGVRYDGPALPQHVVDMDGTPLGAPMVAVQDGEERWRLWPIGDLR